MDQEQAVTINEEKFIGFKKFEEQLNESEKLEPNIKNEAKNQNQEEDIFNDPANIDPRTEEEKERDRFNEFRRAEEILTIAEQKTEVYRQQYEKEIKEAQRIKEEFLKLKGTAYIDKVKAVVGVSEVTEDVILEYEKRTAKQELKQQENEEDNSFFIGKPISLKDLNPEMVHKEWLWENYLAKRHITLLVAYWKAGKSTMLRALFAAMQEEKEFAGEPTKRCKVLVVTEEPEEDWVEKREEFNMENNDNIMIWSRPFKGKPNLRQWNDVIANIVEHCESNKIDLLVFDTISAFFPINREKDSDEWLNALIPLYEFTRRDIGVLLVHHFRKGAGDEAQAFRGSGVLGSFPSNIIEFTRDPEGYFTRRIIKTYGRFSQAIPRVGIDFQPDNTYKTLGDPAVYSKYFRMERLVELISESKEPLSAKEVLSLWATKSSNIDAPTLSLRTVQNYITELVNKGVLSVAGEKVDKDKRVPLYTNTGRSAQKEFDLYNTPPLAQKFEANEAKMNASYMQLGTLAQKN